MAQKIRLSKFDGIVQVADKSKKLQKEDIMRLKLLGFHTRTPNIYVHDSPPADLVIYVHGYLQKAGHDLDFDSSTSQQIKKFAKDIKEYERVLKDGVKIKKQKTNTSIHPPNFNSEIKIKPYQLKSIQHMISVTHAANFSVPGSGKTLMTYAVYDILKQQGIIDSMLVVGPIASFGPWENEYEFCMNKKPSKKILRYHGTQRQRHLRNITDYDIVLTSYDTASNDLDYLKRHLLDKKRVMMIVDESHHIKSFDEDSKHASAMINLGKYAERRYILSGTPVPHSFKDLWSQITFLWPSIKILLSREAYKNMLENYNAKKEISDRIDFLWTRVTNKNLKHDMPPILSDRVIRVPMSKNQEAIYAAIEKDIWKAEQNISDTIDLFPFRKNRIMRLLQSVTNPSVLLFKDDSYNISKFESNDLDLNSNMIKYNETSPKITEAVKLALEITKNNENVVIWTVFVKNVEMLCNELKRLDPGSDPIAISGDVPTDPNAQKDIDGREKRINMFKKSSGRVLVATVGSIAESISLHKTCQRAIYLERNFNAGQYMQSWSRIYRIGSDKNKPVQFIFLQSVLSDGTETIDKKIDIVLKERIKQMHDLLNDEFNLVPLELETTSDNNKHTYTNEEDETNKIYSKVMNMIQDHKEKGKI